MSKIESIAGCVIALVFTNAHAPTIQLGRLFAGPQIAAATPDRIDEMAAVLRYSSSDPLYALERELSEQGDLHRFQIDEFYLPKLNVELPPLFDWSDGERTYLASLHPAYSGLPGAAIDPIAAGGVRLASAEPFAGGGPAARISSSTHPPSEGSNEPGSSPSGSNEGPNDTGRSGDSSDPLDTNPSPLEPITPPSTNPIGVEDSITPVPVPVPVPGTLGLLALGLAGLRLVGRNKRRSG